MRWLSRLTTVAIAGAAIAGVAVGVARLARPSRPGGFHTSAVFRDASGLPLGSRVVIAGGAVGRIDRLTVEGNQARVGMRLRDDVLLCDDAWATKKATSALGDSYVELSPGEADPAAPGGCLAPHRRLRSGEPVPRVIEASSTEEVLRGISNAMPRLDERVASAEAFFAEGRQWVAGPFHERVVALDRALDPDAVGRPLRDVDRALDDFDRRLAEVEAEVGGLAPTAGRRLAGWAADVAAVAADLRTARADVASGLGGVRDQLDRVDPFLADAVDVVAALDGRGERPGRLAGLIEDGELADDLADVAAGGATFTDSLDRLRTVIGFRIENNLLAVQPRFYVIAEIASRADQFYLVELEKGPWGDVPAPRLEDQAGSPTWTRQTLVRERLRFTAQWGKRFGPVSLRIGLKESMFGAGVDGLLAGGRLKLSLDAIESSFERVPRVKLAAALAVYRTLYVVGGVDDALTPGGDLPIAPWPATADVPIQFDELRYGRDYFLGLSLHFTDTDLNRMLFLYGGLLGALISR